MCRYSDKSYKTSFACVKHRHVAQYQKGTKPRCPVCQQPLTEMGREFKAPKKTDNKGWGKLEGFDGCPGPMFDSCGC